MARAAFALVLLYAAALRFDALLAQYGPIPGSPRAEALQLEIREWIRRLRPSELDLTRVEKPYRGDPTTYLRYARAMQSFYAAHEREPLFVFSTKVLLGLLDDHDIAVSVASGLYSTLVVLGTYLVGSFAFSRFVGLGAAFAMATEAWAIRIGVDGWRDDAFTFFVLLTTYGLLRLQRRCSLGNACWAGVFAGAACLTRITSLSFVLPGFAYLLVTARQERTGRRALVLGTSLAIAIGLVAPFLVNCAVVYGDPLHSIDSHTEFYRSRAGEAAPRATSWVDYLGERPGGRPLAFIDLAVRGITTYPFQNKWQGLGYLSQGFAGLLRLGAVAGLVLFLCFAEGRLLLVLLFSSLVPYAFTWRIAGGSEWRFTLHAYPFYLIAAFLTLETIVSLARASTWQRIRAAWSVGQWAMALLAMVGAVGALRSVSGWWGYMLVREAARTNRAYSIVAGPGDDWFFVAGWYPWHRVGSVVGRYSHGARAAIRLPVFQRVDSLLTFRLQAYSPEPRPKRTIQVLVNDTWIADLPVDWRAERTGDYELRVAKELLHPGFNKIDLVADGSAVVPPGEGRFPGLESGQDTAFFLWYVRLTIPQQ